MISSTKQDRRIFLWIAAPVAAAAAVNRYSIKPLLSNSFSIFPIKGNPVFNSGPKSLPKNASDCPILCNWVFDNFVLAEELFTKALRSLETCVLVNNNSRGKLFSSLESPVIFDKRLQSYFFNADFNLLSYQLDNFTFNVLRWVIFILKRK